MRKIKQKPVLEKVLIEDYAAEGKSLARVDGKVIFVEGAVPGDIVDIDIGYASDGVQGYNNRGKYPVILVNGCSAGQVFANDFKWGEDWMLADTLGAIGFIAHADYGFEYALRDYTNTFYDKAFGDSSLIYQPIGRIFQEVISQYRNDKITLPYLKLPKAVAPYKLFSKMVERAQTQIEGNNFDRRKTVLQYDEVLRKQREVIYTQRRDILFEDSIIEIVEGMLKRAMNTKIGAYLDPESKTPKVIADELFKVLDGKYFNPGLVSKSKLDDTPENVYDYLDNLIQEDIKQKIEQFSDEKFNEFLKVVVLRVVDTYWVQHIDQMSELRQGIGLQSYAQMNPLREYQETGFTMFNELVRSIEDNVTRYVLRAVIRDNLQRVQVAKPTSTHSGKEETTKRKPVTTSKVGRNDPCPCGSGKKYKQCHGR